jgi:hypothetical protein
MEQLALLPSALLLFLYLKMPLGHVAAALAVLAAVFLENWVVGLMISPRQVPCC